jgi:hypothetical protein
MPIRVHVAAVGPAPAVPHQIVAGYLIVAVTERVPDQIHVLAIRDGALVLIARCVIWVGLGVIVRQRIVLA